MPNILAYIGCCLIWSSTWLFIKTGLEDFDPLTFLAVRFVLAAPLLWIASGVARERLPRGWGEWRLTAFLGLGMLAVPYTLIYWGEGRLPSGLTAVLFGMQPLFAMLFAHYLLTHEKFRPAQLLGVLLGLGGVALVCLSGLTGRAEWPGAVAVLASAACQGFMAVFAKKHAHGMPQYGMLAWANLFGGLMVAAPALLTEPHPVHRLGTNGLVSLLFLAVFGSAVAFVLVFRLFRAWEATKTSTISLVTPPLALLWGWLFLKEPLGAGYLAGSALVIAGVWQANRVRAKAA